MKREISNNELVGYLIYHWLLEERNNNKVIVVSVVVTVSTPGQLRAISLSIGKIQMRGFSNG